MFHICRLDCSILRFADFAMHDVFSQRFESVHEACRLDERTQNVRHETFTINWWLRSRDSLITIAWSTALVNIRTLNSNPPLSPFAQPIHFSKYLLRCTPRLCILFINPPRLAYYAERLRVVSRWRTSAPLPSPLLWLHRTRWRHLFWNLTDLWIRYSMTRNKTNNLQVTLNMCKHWALRSLSVPLVRLRTAEGVTHHSVFARSTIELSFSC